MLYSKNRLPVPIKKLWFGSVILYEDIIRCDLFKQASAMTYTTLLSMIPSLAVVFSILTFFTPILAQDSVVFDNLKNYILENLASGSGRDVVKYLESMLFHLDFKSLGWTSLLMMLGVLTILLKQIEVALNRIWLVLTARNILIRFFHFWTFLTLGALVLGVLLSILTNTSMNEVANSNFGVLSGGILRKFYMSYIFSFVFFFLMYKFVPNCKVHFKSAISGAVVAVLLIKISSKLYFLFILKANNYEVIYGALAALPLFLTWIWICWVIILFGALIAWRSQIGFVFEHEQDTFDAVKTPLEYERNNQIKSFLPLYVLIRIYKNNRDSNIKDEDSLVNAQKLANDLSVPLSWIELTLETLCSTGYVVQASTSQTFLQGLSSANYHEYYPAVAADKVKIYNIIVDLYNPGWSWCLDIEDSNMAFKSIGMALIKFFKQPKQETSFSDFVDQMY